MKIYNIEISVDAQTSIDNYVYFIRDEYKSPITADKHLFGLYLEIYSLRTYAESIQVSTLQRVLKHGPNARSIKYKKMCIIYTVHNEKVIVHELLPCSMIISDL
jgi:hypothetical protein